MPINNKDPQISTRYFDDELIFGIEGETLHNKTGGIIPVVG